MSKSNKRAFIAAVAGAAIMVAGAWSAAAAQPEISGDLIVFHAGSLSVPLKEAAAAFMGAHPGVKVLLEAAGSRECARKIADLERPCDVMVSSDYAVIDSLLIPKYAAWNITFAGNEMVLAYREKSRCAEEISAANWYEVLLRTDVAFARSDPNADPCGYRTLFVIQLAERYYAQPGLTEKLTKKDARYIRPKETDLLALLETGTVDYLFIYRSVAQQHGLKWVTLPAEINLSNPAFADKYREARATLSGATPGSTQVQQGDTIAYGITIPNNAPNPAAARAFVAFLLDKEKGLAILERNGQTPLVPSPAKTYDQIPDELRRFASRP